MKMQSSRVAICAAVSEYHLRSPQLNGLVCGALQAYQVFNSRTGKWELLAFRDMLAERTTEWRQSNHAA